MKRILVLEDEPSLMNLLHRVLVRHGYDTLEAASPEEALQQFNDSGRQIDLLLADVGLPVISGVQVALLLRAELPGLRVILTSGYPPVCGAPGIRAFSRRLDWIPSASSKSPLCPRPY